MKTTVTETGAWNREIDVELSEDEVKPFLEKAYRSYQKKIHIDGFRKGKVPISLIKKRFGEAIRAEVADEVIQEYFKKAIDTENLETIAPGKVQEVSINEGEPFHFKAEVEVEPKVEVTDYQDFKVEKEILKVTKDDVQKTLDVLVEQRAERKEIEGKAEAGHIIEGDIQALDSSGVPLIGDKWENSVIELGAPPLGDVVQDQLLGAVKGEEKRFKLVQPMRGEDGQVTHQESHYSIHVKSVKEKILPKLDDDFAKALGDFQTLSALEDNILKNLTVQREEDSDRALNRRIADEIVKRNDFQVPPSMIENLLQSSWEEYQKRPEKDMDESSFKEENRASALWTIKWHLIEKKLMDMEHIQVSDEEVNDEIDKMAAASPKQEKKIKAEFKDAKRRERLQENIAQRKLMDVLKEHIKIKEVVIKRPKDGKSPIIT